LVYYSNNLSRLLLFIKTNQAINQKVYELYGLTAEEIKIIESN